MNQQNSKSTCLVDIVSMKLLDLALTWKLWLDGSGSGCNPDRVTPDLVGAIRTGLHLVSWMQPGQGCTRLRGCNPDRVTPDFLGATWTGLHPLRLLAIWSITCAWVYVLDKNPYISNFCTLILPTLIWRNYDRTPLIIDFYCIFGPLYFQTPEI